MGFLGLYTRRRFTSTSPYGRDINQRGELVGDFDSPLRAGLQLADHALDHVSGSNSRLSPLCVFVRRFSPTESMSARL